MDRLWIVDGHAAFFRAYHAIRGGMTSPVTGEPTHLVYGFTGTLLNMIRTHQPTKLVVVIDAAGDTETFRTKLYADYKANRDEAPEDFGPQVERCLELLRLMRIPVFGLEGVEADDTIASIITQCAAKHSDLAIRIASRDKDLTQLCSPRVDMFDAMKDALVTPSDVFKTEGVEPHMVGDILALMGDTADNIPGVPGIGPKTAAKLIIEHGDLEGLYEALPGLKGKKMQAIGEHRETTALARQLVELKRDLDTGFDLDDADFDGGQIDLEGLDGLCRQLGFNTYPRSFRELAGAEASAPEAPATEAVPTSRKSSAAPDPIDGGLFGAAEAEAEPTTPKASLGNYRCLCTAEEVQAYAQELLGVDRFAFDTETTSLRAREAALVGLSFSTKAGEAVYIPVDSPDPSQHLGLSEVLDMLQPVLAQEGIRKVAHNLKYDLQILRGAGFEVVGPFGDTMISSYLLDSTRSSHGLDALSLGLLGMEMTPISTLIGKGKSQIGFAEVPLDKAADYAAEDADATLRLDDLLQPKLVAEDLDRLAQDVELPLVEVLAEMEWNGIGVDLTELARQQVRLQDRIEEIAAEVAAHAPHPFNPDSPKQLSAALFNAEDADAPGLGLKPIKKGKSGTPSTDLEVLEKLRDDPGVDTPIPALVIEYRQLTKLVGTYLASLPEHVCEATGRIHASFHQAVASTGRLSSSDPNLQNIPIRTDVGREIRRAFVADEGNLLVTADYSQIELRILAHLSGDPALREAFELGADIHTAVASQTFDVEPEEVDDTQRSTAKMINFGIVYGITAFGLSRRLNHAISPGEAQQVIDDYKARFVGIDRFLAACVQEAKDTGYVRTILGRRRPIEGIDQRNPMLRQRAERYAINTVVQGSAADLIKVAMVDVHRRLPKAFPEARLLLQIHDELVLECPSGQAEALRDFVVQAMAGAMPDLEVPITAGSSIGATWIEAK